MEQGNYYEAAIEYEKAVYSGEGDSLWLKVINAYEKAGMFDKAYKFLDKYQVDDITRGRIFFWVGDIESMKMLSYPYNRYFTGLFFISEGRFKEAYNEFPEDSLGNIVKKTIAKYEQINYKNPYLAATMSMIIPGSGRIYAGNFKNGIFNFLLCGIMGGASYYYYRTNSPLLSYITGAAFLGFYLGDIYGSFIGVLKYNRWQKIKLIREVYNVPVLRPFIYP